MTVVAEPSRNVATREERAGGHNRRELVFDLRWRDGESTKRVNAIIENERENIQSNQGREGRSLLRERTNERTNAPVPRKESGG